MSGVWIFGSSVVLSATAIAVAALRTPVRDPEPCAECTRRTAAGALVADERSLPIGDEVQEYLADMADLAAAGDDDQVIAAALDRAIDHLASWQVGGRLGLSADELGRLSDRVYDDLRASLTRPQLMRALVAELATYADARALALIGQFRALPTTDRESI